MYMSIIKSHRTDLNIMITVVVDNVTSLIWNIQKSSTCIYCWDER